MTLRYAILNRFQAGVKIKIGDGKFFEFGLLFYLYLLAM